MLKFDFFFLYLQANTFLFKRFRCVLYSSGKRAMVQNKVITIFESMGILMDGRIYLFIFDKQSQVEVNTVFRLSIQTDLMFKHLGFYSIGNS